MQYALVVVWLAAFLALALSALPLAAALFPRFADRGAAFALPVALAVLGVVGYLVGQVAFGWPALAAALVLVVAASYFVGDQVEVDTRAFAEVAVVFTVAFLLIVVVRGYDPNIDPYAGEKFLDYGLLRSLLRSTNLPPEDMWFAGESVQYYYGGHLVAALLTRLTFTPPQFAYNLALAGFFGAYVAAAWGIAGNVAAALGAPRRLAAALGAFFVALASNLYTFARVVFWLLPNGVATTLAGVVGLDPEIAAWTPAQFSYWPASRVIPGTINEFPLFAWLNGDLHAHMMSPPFLLLVAALCLSYWLTPAVERTRRRALVFGAVPPVAGLLALVNTWSFPTAVGLTALTLTFAPASPATLLPRSLADRLSVATLPDGGAAAVPEGGWLRHELSRGGLALVFAAVTLVVGAVWVLPFWLGTASGRAVGLLPDRSSLGGLLLVHGVFLFAFAPYLWQRAAGLTDDRRFLLGGVLLFVGLAWLADLAAVALFGPLLVAAWGLLRLRRDVGFETVLALAGVGLVLVVEFAYVVEQAGPSRFNTVFKTYAQVWALWAPAAGVALARLVTTGRETISVPDAAAWRDGARVLVVFLVFSTSLYGAFALPAHVESGQSDPTLDGTAWVGTYHPSEAQAIAWLDAREGQPNIVSAPACWCHSSDSGATPYRWANAPSSLTGVPTVLGWQHEVGYRSEEAYNSRYRDVRTIYEGDPAAQARLLRKYNVEYVYVGPNERAVFEEDFSGVSGVTVAARFGDVVIYRVSQPSASG